MATTTPAGGYTFIQALRDANGNAQLAIDYVNHGGPPGSPAYKAFEATPARVAYNAAQKAAPPGGGGGFDLFKSVGDAVTQVTQAVGNAAARIGNDITHPQDALDDLGHVVTALPGLALTAATWLPNLAAQAAGGAASAIGGLTGWSDLKNAGDAIVKTDTDLIKSAVSNPVGSAEILGGAALAASGIGGPAGVGLIVKGTADLVIGATNPPAPQSTQPLGTRPRVIEGTVPGTVAPSGITGAVESLFDRFVAWVRRVL